MKRTLLLLLALLCMLPAAHAAGPETLYPIAYCFREIFARTRSRT